MWVYISFAKELSPGKLPQGGGQVVNVSRSPPGDQVPVIRISSIQPNVLLLDCKIQGVPVSAVVDCGSPICILSSDVFNHIGFGDTLGRVGSKVVGAEGSQLNILGTVELDIAVDGIKAKQLFYICDNLKQSALLGMDFLRDNGCVVDFNGGTLHAGDTQVKLKDEPSWEVHRVSLVDTVTIQPDQKVDLVCEVKGANLEGIQGVLEPMDRFFQRFPIAVPSTLSLVSKGSVPVRFYNYSDQPVTIYKNTSVGEFCPAVERGQTIPTARNYRIETILDDSNKGTLNCNMLSFEAEPNWDTVDEMKKLFPIDNDQITEDQKLNVWRIIAKHCKAVSRGPHDIGHCTKAQLRINTGSAPSSRLPLRRFSPAQEKYISEETQRLLERDVIEPSTSPWSAQVVLASKKDGSYRYCVDFRRLNCVTVKEHYPVPRVEDMIDTLAGAKFFSTLDLISAYHAFEIHPDDREKTAFSTKQGHWQWKRVPFGLCNVAPFFVRQIASLLAGMTWEELLAFFDDVLVFSPTFAKHCESLDRALTLIEEAGLKVKPEKCRILPQRVPFVGHILSAQGVSTDPEKVSAVKSWPPPTNLSQLRVFLGKIGYYRKFIPDFATLAAPLFQLEEKGRNFVWSNNCQKSFDTLKQALCEAPVLAFPRFDLPFVLDTDASTTGVAAVLSQVQDGEERPIAYAAKALTKSQRKWAPTKIEMYALVFGTEAFYPYLISKQFVARLDHRSLVWLQTFKQPKPQEARWVEYLQQFDMKIEHRPGRLHANADGLSRRPWPATQVADMPEEAENSPAPVIVGKTASSDATPSVEGGQSECKQSPPLWSNAHLRREQPKDKHLNAALQWLKAGKRPPKQEMAGVDRHMWSLWSQYDRLVLQNEVLYRRWFDEKTGRESLQLCVPQHLKGDLLQELHDLCGHLSVLKTTDNVRKRFYWFGHTADIELYCQTCHTCGSRNGPIPRPRAPMQSIKTGYPLERIQIDILGPLPETNRGNKYVAVVEDMYTKWPEAYALPNQEADTVAQAVMDNFVCRFGCPIGVLSDQGRNFESWLFRGLCDLIEFVKQRTTPYHPQCDGVRNGLFIRLPVLFPRLQKNKRNGINIFPRSF